MLKKIFIFFGVIISLFVIFSIWNIVSYKSNDIKVEDKNNLTVYKDNKFGYSFSYPSRWTRNNGSAIDQGYVEIRPSDDPNTQVKFWYKDSKKINTLEELKSFVRDEAKYSEEQQKNQTISITNEILNGRSVVVLKSIIPQGHDNLYSTQYYFADLTPTHDQNIFIRIINVVSRNKEMSGHINEITKILNSFKLN